jgi:hypothetical protein
VTHGTAGASPRRRPAFPAAHWQLPCWRVVGPSQRLKLRCLHGKTLVPRTAPRVPSRAHSRRPRALKAGAWWLGAGRVFILVFNFYNFHLFNFHNWGPYRHSRRVAARSGLQMDRRWILVSVSAERVKDQGPTDVAGLSTVTNSTPGLPLATPGHAGHDSVVFPNIEESLKTHFFRECLGSRGA